LTAVVVVIVVVVAEMKPTERDHLQFMKELSNSNDLKLLINLKGHESTYKLKYDDQLSDNLFPASMIGFIYR